MSTIVRNTMPPIVNAADVIYVYIRIIEINTLSLSSCDGPSFVIGGTRPSRDIRSDAVSSPGCLSERGVLIRTPYRSSARLRVIDRLLVRHLVLSPRLCRPFIIQRFIFPTRNRSPLQPWGLNRLVPWPQFIRSLTTRLQFRYGLPNKGEGVGSWLRSKGFSTGRFVRVIFSGSARSSMGHSPSMGSNIFSSAGLILLIGTLTSSSRGVGVYIGS